MSNISTVELLVDDKVHSTAIAGVTSGFYSAVLNNNLLSSGIHKLRARAKLSLNTAVNSSVVTPEISVNTQNNTTVSTPRIENFTVKKLVNGNFVDVPSKEFFKSSTNSDSLQFNWSVSGTIPPEFTQLNGRYKFAVAIRPPVVNNNFPSPIFLAGTSQVTASTLSSVTVQATLGNAPYGPGQTFVVCLVDKDNLDSYCDGAMLGTSANPKATIENVTISSSSGNVLGASTSSSSLASGCTTAGPYNTDTGELCPGY